MIGPPTGSPRARSRGSSSVEAAIVIPVLLIFITVLVAGSRIAIAQQAVTGAAQAGARSASIERSAETADSAARTAIAQSLNGSGVECDPDVAVSGDWQLPVGQAGMVAVSVDCRVALSDLLIPGLPGSILISRSADSPIDRYRSRTPG